MIVTPVIIDTLGIRALALIDWFLPEEARHGRRQLRDRLFVVTSFSAFAASLLALPFAFVAGTGSDPTGELVLILSFGGTPFLLRRTGSRVIAGGVQFGCTIAVTTLMALRTGGLYSGQGPWYPLVPLAASFLITPLVGVLCAALLCGHFALILHLHHVGAIPPPVFNPKTTLTAIATSSSVAVIFSALFSSLYARSRDRADRLLDGANRKLQKSEETLMAVLENTDEAIWSVNARLEVMVFNSVAAKRLREVFGTPLERGAPLLSAGSPAAWRERYLRSLAGERTTFEDELVVDGELRAYEFSYNPIIDSGSASGLSSGVALSAASGEPPDGLVEGVTVFCKDITERRRVALAHARLAAAIEAAKEIVLLGDSELRIQFANPAFERITGTPASAVIGRDLRGLWSSDERAASLPLTLERVVITRNVKTDEQLDIEQTIAPVLDRDDPTRPPVAYVAICHDVTESHRAHARLQAVSGQLIEASRYAGMAQVAAGALHNVGNALNSINVSSSLLSDRVRELQFAGLASAAALLRTDATPERVGRLASYLELYATHGSDEQRAALQEIDLLRKNIDHVKTIIAAQQAFAGRAGVSEKILLTALVDDALELSRAALDRHGIEVVRDLADLPALLLDRHRVLEILINLFSNAQYALKDLSVDRKRQLTVRLRLDGEQHLRFEVSDNGVGIAAENLPRIFQHGFTTKVDGHGFGLHSSAIAAKELGGSLTVESAGVHRGATFTLVLPATWVQAVA